jgi:hypothetical protein
MNHAVTITAVSTRRNIEAADVADFAEFAKIVETGTQEDTQNWCSAGIVGAAN